jgi:DNA-binding NarL/FixJ family response regulator
VDPHPGLVTTTVLVVDDQPLVRDGFSLILEQEAGIDVVGTASDGLSAVDAVARLDPDVVLMDVRMPELDGIEATRRILAGGQRRPAVLILTTFDLDEYVFSALRAGASGFLLKDVHRQHLVEAIRVVAAGDALLAPAVTRRLVEEFVRRPDASDIDLRSVAQLTPRERDALERLARGLSNAEIAMELSVGEATAKTHVGNVLMKLGLRDRVQAVIFAYESGIVRPAR